MSAVQYTQSSTSLILNGYSIVDLQVGDTIVLNFPNPATGRMNASNNGVSITERADKDVAVMTINVMKNSPADDFFSRAKSQGLTIFNGSWKENVIRDGSDRVDSYLLSNGSLVDQPANTKNNQDGNGLMAYAVEFRQAVRVS